MCMGGLRMGFDGPEAAPLTLHRPHATLFVFFDPWSGIRPVQVADQRGGEADDE